MGRAHSRVLGYMERLKILVLSEYIMEPEIIRVRDSLKYFHQHLESASTLDITQWIEFEDLSSKNDSFELRHYAHKFGYILAAGVSKEKSGQINSLSDSLIVCQTIHPKEWSGPLRDHVVKQLKTFVEQWNKSETEEILYRELEEGAINYTWKDCSLYTLTRLLHFMTLNQRPFFAVFEDSGLMIQDATKKLPEPIEQTVCLIIPSISSVDYKHIQNNGIKNYIPFTVEEFSQYLQVLIGYETGNDIHIILKS